MEVIEMSQNGALRLTEKQSRAALGCILEDLGVRLASYATRASRSVVRSWKEGTEKQLFHLARVVEVVSLGVHRRKRANNVVESEEKALCLMENGTWAQLTTRVSRWSSQPGVWVSELESMTPEDVARVIAQRADIFTYKLHAAFSAAFLGTRERARLNVLLGEAWGEIAELDTRRRVRCL